MEGEWKTLNHRQLQRWHVESSVEGGKDHQEEARRQDLPFQTIKTIRQMIKID